MVCSPKSRLRISPSFFDVKIHRGKMDLKMGISTENKLGVTGIQFGNDVNCVQNKY